MAKSTTYLIINPVSAGGRTLKRYDKVLNAFRKIFGTDFNFNETAKPLDAITITRNALLNGAESVICVGGDGTVNEVVNGFYDNGKIIDQNAGLGVISSGTGQGFAQSLGLPLNLDEQVKIIYEGKYKLIDVGKVSFANGNGNQCTRYFVNEFQAGIGGAVVRNAGTNTKRLGGFIAFALTTIATAITHPNQRITLKIDRNDMIIKNFPGLVFANGEFTGGGMNLVPHASPEDGKMDILLMHEQGRIERLKNFTKIYSGRHLESEKFDIVKAVNAEIISKEKVLLEADGELLGYLPCKVSLLPSQIKVYN